MSMCMHLGAMRSIATCHHRPQPCFGARRGTIKLATSIITARQPKTNLLLCLHEILDSVSPVKQDISCLKISKNSTGTPPIIPCLYGEATVNRLLAPRTKFAGGNL